ncbi:MAG: hypothetical protein V1744_05330 [Candidatus Altiarchaeota archaeon]
MMVSPLRLALCIFLVSALGTAVGAVRVTDISVSDDPVDYLDTFEVTAKLSGDTCNLQAWFYVDNYIFDRKNVGCESEEVKGKFNLKAEDWDLFKVTCGQKQAKVELYTSATQSMVANDSVSFNIGVMPGLEFTPAQPVPNKEARVKLYDNDNGNPLGNVDLTIKDIYGGDPITGKTVISDGGFSFMPKAAGEYHLTMRERDICGDITFYVKRPLMIDGPRPENPVIGEMVAVAVPAGASVGVKILDSGGGVYKTPPVSYNGGSNFTIDKPGTYTLIVGDESTKYWSINKTITVSDRLTPEIKVSPDQPVVGKPATITVSSRGEGLAGARVTVKKPDGVERDYTTENYGSVNYETITSTGTYTIRVSKERYADASSSFEAKHYFDAAFSPSTPNVKDTLDMTVNDQNAKPVGDVLVEIQDIGFRRVTDMGGKISFNLQEPKEYEIKLSKDMFWDKAVKLTPFGILSMGECLQEFELGGNITISTYDSFNNPAAADINFKDPDGIVKYYPNTQSYTLTPDKPGGYTATVSKTNYLNANVTFKVKPHPLNVQTHMSSGQLYVNVTSNSNPVSSIKVSVTRASETLNGTTDAQGIAVFNMNREGNITLIVNGGGSNIYYDEKTLRQNILRSYELVLLATPLVVIFVITLITIVVVQLGRKYMGNEWTMPSFSFGRPRMKTKHDSVLLGDDGKKSSRLSKL